MTFQCFLSKIHYRKSCKSSVFIFKKNHPVNLIQAYRCWFNFIGFSSRHFEYKHTLFSSLQHWEPKLENYIISVSITSWKMRDHFQRKVKRPQKKHPFLFFKFPVTDFFPIKTPLNWLLQTYSNDTFYSWSIVPNRVQIKVTVAEWAHSRQEAAAAVRAFSPPIYWRHLGTCSFIHFYDMFTCQVSDS